MGSFFSKLLTSSNAQPIAPPVIKQEDLLNNDEKTIEQLRENYRTLGFAVVECTDEFKTLCSRYRGSCEDWFHENTFASKKEWIAPKIDNLLGRPNIGYILTPHKKEYLRFKDSTKKEQFPSEDIYNQFQELIQQWHNIANVSMRSILTENVLYSEKMHPRHQLKSNQYKNNNNNKKGKQKKVEPTMQPICEEVDKIAQFGKIHSSISIVHYFKENEGVTVGENVNNNVNENGEEKTRNKDENDEKKQEKGGEKAEKKENSVETHKDTRENENKNEKKETKKGDDDDVKSEVKDGGGNDEIGESDLSISNRTEAIALDKHNDTGLMTFIICSDVNGLEMLDRGTDKYFHCEPHYYDKNKCHMFIIAGRKMEIFSFKKEIKATWHRVTIPVEQERMTLLYFMEITKEH